MPESGSVRTRGRAARLPDALNVRALSHDEVEAHNAREAGVQPSPLQRLSNRHQQLARALASGMRPSEAALHVGLSVSRVSILQADPTFQELLAFHRRNVDAAFMGLAEKMAGLSEDAVDVLTERLESDPNSFDNGELESLARTFADRTGHAPKRVEEKNFNFNFGERLDAARARAKVIETTYAELVEDEEAAA